jgi:hypothetical protein
MLLVCVSERRKASGAPAPMTPLTICGRGAG